MIAYGEVPNQPKGTNLLKMKYDDVLAEKGRAVSLQCKIKRVKITDDRWHHVGQNLYIEYSSTEDPTQNWEAAIKAWFNEHNDYTYGQKYSWNTAYYTSIHSLFGLIQTVSDVTLSCTQISSTGTRRMSNYTHATTDLLVITGAEVNMIHKNTWVVVTISCNILTYKCIIYGGVFNLH
ncbi:uncharacterized protein [Atheta coriaria]|uniref:uncharacterized protein n=1 Tax=Dalotia coriaria TaxID=877792 RepID=UPI0031F3693F